MPTSELLRPQEYSTPKDVILRLFSVFGGKRSWIATVLASYRIEKPEIQKIKKNWQKIGILYSLPIFLLFFPNFSYFLPISLPIFWNLGFFYSVAGRRNRKSWIELDVSRARRGLRAIQTIKSLSWV